MGERETYLPFGRLTAASFWVAWITVVFSGDIIVSSSVSAYETTSFILVWATFGMGVAMVAGACAPKASWRVIMSWRSMTAVGIACALFTFAMGFEAVIPRWAFVCSTILSGMTVSFLLIRCAVIFADTTTRTSAMFAGACGLAGALIYAMFSLVAQFHSTLVVLAISSALPLFGITASFLERDADEVSLLRDAATERLTPAFWRVVAFMAVISFTLSVIRGFYPRLIDPIQFAGSRADAAFLLSFVFILFLLVVITRKRDYPFGSLFYRLFILAVVFMVPVVMLGAFSSYSGSLATVSKGLLFLAAWCFLSLWSYKTGMSAVKVFGFGFGSTMVASFLGYAAGNFMGSKMSISYGTLFESIVLLLCVVLAITLLRIRDLQEILTPSSAMMESIELDSAELKGEVDSTSGNVSRENVQTTGDSATKVAYEHVSLTSADGNDVREAIPTSNDDEKIPSGKPGRFKIRCNLIAEEYELTPREADVFFLLAKHMEVKAIADELCVSFNTARTHVRHIYAKLEIHNRRELDDLVDTFEIDHP